MTRSKGAINGLVKTTATNELWYPILVIKCVAHGYLVLIKRIVKGQTGSFTTGSRCYMLVNVINASRMGIGDILRLRTVSS